MRMAFIIVFLILTPFRIQAENCIARFLGDDSFWTKEENTGYMGLQSDNFNYNCNGCGQYLSIRVSPGSALSMAYDFYGEEDFLEKIDSDYSKQNVALLSVADLKLNDKQAIRITSTNITSFNVMGQRYKYLHYEAQNEPEVENQEIKYIGFVTAREGYTCSIVVTYYGDDLTTTSRVRVSNFMNNLVI